MGKFFGNLHAVLLAGLVLAVAMMLAFGADTAVDVNSITRWLHVFLAYCGLACFII